MRAKKLFLFEELKHRLFYILQRQHKGLSMRALKKFRPTFPTCIPRKVSDERPKKRTLEMGDFPLHILETRRKERLAELKAEAVELKNQLSENNLPAALVNESDLGNETNNNNPIPILSGQHSKSMHELRGLRNGLAHGSSGSSNLSICSEDSMRRRREERLQTIRRELQDFAIKYSIGEFSEKIDGLANDPPAPRKSSESLLLGLKVPPAGGQQNPRNNGSTQDKKFMIASMLPRPAIVGLEKADPASFLRLQRQRELELQRARLELKHLAFRLKHKLDEEKGDQN